LDGSIAQDDQGFILAGPDIIAAAAVMSIWQYRSSLGLQATEITSVSSREPTA
jgi:hypothetical protein